MQKHIEVYLMEFGYYPGDFIRCEIGDDCGAANDIHHIEPRSSFGKKRKDEQDKIENLMALCRFHHEEYGQIKDCKELLKKIHLARLQQRKDGRF